jgi:hypothetical protein
MVSPVRHTYWPLSGRNSTYPPVQISRASSPSGPLRPSDSILVLPKVETKGLQTTKDIMQVIYQIAVSAAVVPAL